MRTRGQKDEAHAAAAMAWAAIDRRTSTSGRQPQARTAGLGDMLRSKPGKVRSANDRRLAQLEHKTKMAEEYNARIKRVMRFDLRRLNRSKYQKEIIARWKKEPIGHADARGTAGGGVSAAN